MADMWAIGLIVIELVIRKRLGDPVWDAGIEVSQRRADLLRQVARVDETLCEVTTALLHLDKNRRLSAGALKAHLLPRACAHQRTADEEAKREAAAAAAAAEEEEQRKREKKRKGKKTTDDVVESGRSLLAECEVFFVPEALRERKVDRSVSVNITVFGDGGQPIMEN